MKNIKSLVMVGLLSASMLVSVGCQNTSDVIYESDVMKITLENEFVDIKELEGNYGYSYKDVLCEYVADVTVERKIEEDFNMGNLEYETYFNGEGDVVYCSFLHTFDDINYIDSVDLVSTVKKIKISIFDEDVSIEDIKDGKVEVRIYSPYTDKWEELDF